MELTNWKIIFNDNGKESSIISTHIGDMSKKDASIIVRNYLFPDGVLLIDQPSNQQHSEPSITILEFRGISIESFEPVT